LSKFCAGQLVRLWSVEEICAEYNCSPQELEDGVITDGIEFPGYAIEYCGHEYKIESVDDGDSTVFLEGANIWVSQSVIDLVKDFDGTFGFKVGDRVVFKDWADMEEDGSIEYNWFVPEMKYLCGHEAVITEINRYNTKVSEVRLKDCTTNLGAYQFSTAMLEHAAEVPEVNEDSFLSLIGR